MSHDFDDVTSGIVPGRKTPDEPTVDHAADETEARTLPDFIERITRENVHEPAFDNQIGVECP